MNRNYVFGDVNDALPRLLSELQQHGDEVGSRAGRTLELTHVGITLERPTDRYLYLPERKHSIAAQIAETMWVLSGRDDMAFLSNYLPRAKDFSDDGETWRAGYGKRIRRWDSPLLAQTTTDQLAYVVDKLKSDPLTRQAVISIWDPQIDSQPGKDIPCNDWITFSNRLGRLDMHVALRSNDVIWGWSGINAFEWSCLLEIVAGLVGVDPGKLHFSTTSFHLYEHHLRKAGKIIKSSAGTTRPLVKKAPAFSTRVMELGTFDELARRWFSIEELIRTSQNSQVPMLIDAFPEPMLQSWLRVLQWWWSGDDKYLEPLKGTSLDESCRHSIAPPKRETVVDGDEITKAGVSTAELEAGWENARKVFKGAVTSPHLPPMGLFSGNVQELKDATGRSPFIVAACKLHLEKHEAYGDSWKKRGEMVSILANIARKVDRLGGSETSDETSADTAMDLMIYLAKYRTWLTDIGMGAGPSKPDFLYSEDPHWANELLLKIEADCLREEFVQKQDIAPLEKMLKSQFESLFQAAAGDTERYQIADSMLQFSYRLARQLWEIEQLGVKCNKCRLNDTVKNGRCTHCGADESYGMTDAASVGGGTPGSWSLESGSDEYRGADHD